MGCLIVGMFGGDTVYTVCCWMYMCHWESLAGDLCWSCTRLWKSRAVRTAAVRCSPCRGWARHQMVSRSLAQRGD